ncbi:MAG: Kae1-associated serine/threonine protein kinase [Nitrososphaerota archaeon]|nr:Kae1-associated serine/threonine protein kinase [Nitrososphaerota archaeon]
MEKLIKRGAEADILLGWWGPLRAVYKVRRAKPYMVTELDLKLRKARTIREASVMPHARKAGANTPYIFYVGIRTFTIVMQYIEGLTMKEMLDDKPVLAAELGRTLSKLHSAGIIHGDPNTANFILSDANRLWYTVDYGLSFFSSELEDIAVDIHIIKEMLAAQHKRVFQEAFNHFLTGYSETAGHHGLTQILKKLNEIERRGRYGRQLVD